MKSFFLILVIIAGLQATAQDSSQYSKNEVIYGRKDGMALTMIQMTPKQNSNGKAIISVVSGNWVSSYRMAESHEKGAVDYTKRGYTVFLVMHGSQPRYAITDETADIKRAVRFIRYNAKTYGIDPNHIGITGYSSGGNLSLLVATTDEVKETSANDPVDKESSRVQAAAVFFPPTDMLHFGSSQNFDLAQSRKMLAAFGVGGAFDFKQLDPKTKMYVADNDSVLLVKTKIVSPIYAVSSDDPPTIIIHGDADIVVPLSQSQAIIEKFKEAHVPNDLIVIPGKGHGWPDMSSERGKMADWFDKYLK
ncbi:MAG: alpha/beta hydrolase [Chitinophagaceae bacterium]